MKVPITNNGKTHMAVGSTLIPPGETRHFEEQDVPHYLRPGVSAEKPVEPPVDPLVELLKGNVPSVVVALEGMLFTDIERLGDLEQQGQARKGVLGAIADKLLQRASITELLSQIPALSDADLAAALLAVSTDINANTDYVAALEAEYVKRVPV